MKSWFRQFNNLEIQTSPARGGPLERALSLLFREPLDAILAKRQEEEEKKKAEIAAVEASPAGIICHPADRCASIRRGRRF